MKPNKLSSLISDGMPAAADAVILSSIAIYVQQLFFPGWSLMFWLPVVAFVAAVIMGLVTFQVLNLKRLLLGKVGAEVANTSYNQDEKLMLEEKELEREEWAEQVAKYHLEDELNDVAHLRMTAMVVATIYFVAALLPFLFFVFLPHHQALYLSWILAAILLVAIAFISSETTGRGWFKESFRLLLMAVASLLAVRFLHYLLVDFAADL